MFAPALVLESTAVTMATPTMAITTPQNPPAWPPMAYAVGAEEDRLTIIRCTQGTTR
jgi:hypothetical protein